jgi:hypothetical protein
MKDLSPQFQEYFKKVSGAEKVDTLAVDNDEVILRLQYRFKSINMTELFDKMTKACETFPNYRAAVELLDAIKIIKSHLK